MIYYKNRKTIVLAMANKINSHKHVLGQTNVFYDFKCPMPHNELASHISITQARTLHRDNAKFAKHAL